MTFEQEAPHSQGRLWPVITARNPNGLLCDIAWRMLLVSLDGLWCPLRQIAGGYRHWPPSTVTSRCWCPASPRLLPGCSSIRTVEVEYDLPSSEWKSYRGGVVFAAIDGSGAISPGPATLLDVGKLPASRRRSVCACPHPVCTAAHWHPRRYVVFSHKASARLATCGSRSWIFHHHDGGV